MNKILTANWFAPALGAVVYLASMVMMWQTPKLPAVVTGPVVNTIGPSWDFSNPEADQLVAELKSQKQALDDREQQLNDWAARLQSESAELSEVTQRVTAMQAEFDKSVTRVGADEAVNLKKLAKVYAEMSPDTTASIFSQMEDSEVVKIMVFMKDDQTAAIFESMTKGDTNSARHTAMLSERLRMASTHPK